MTTMDTYDNAMDELRRLNREALPLKGKGVIVGVKHGYISGMPYLTTSDGAGAFTFLARELRLKPALVAGRTNLYSPEQAETIRKRNKKPGPKET